MQVELFIEKLDVLMEAALQPPEVPLPRVIYELEMAKQRMVRLQLHRESQAIAQVMARKIMPANGTLPTPIIEQGGT